MKQESQESVHLDDNQPLSPTSSVASHDTDVTIPFTGTNPNQRRGRSKQRGKTLWSLFIIEFLYVHSDLP